MIESLKSSWKRFVTVYVNIGLVVVLYGLLFASGITGLPESNDLDCAVKLILSSIAATTVIFGIVIWDMVSGINIIEQKLKDIEKKIK